MHYYLHAPSKIAYRRPTLSVPMPFNTADCKREDKDLLQYWKHCQVIEVASHSLTTLHHDPRGLGTAVVRIALAPNTQSVAAVFQSLLALSSLHRDGPQSHASTLKGSALRALAAAASNTNLSTREEVIQHIAAGPPIILHLQSVDVVHRCNQGTPQFDCLRDRNDRDDPDVAALIHWVYYHDVLSRFTLRHRDSSDLSAMRISHTPPGTDIWPACSLAFPHVTKSHPLTDGDGSGSPSSSADNTKSVTQAALGLLSVICESVSRKTTSRMSIHELQEYKALVQVLDWRVRCLPIKRSGISATCAAIRELYQLAILVYLNRITDNILNQATRTHAYIDRAFQLFSNLSACERQFPLLILGVEARSDAERAIVLDLLARTEETISSRSTIHCTILIHAMWAQVDLGNEEFNYGETMTSLITSCINVPSLV
ncbi:hypothetical protein LTR99_006062 [Exophiala xenobiotica]|uniref:Uncharacterized protein n=1 Tax=Vermiconidia calcicola TaxID=1690605 RepID=A0AAV9QFU6_9PEZI|nr:hypothetical protein LTR96_007647 [Exophiala xenobiotica]KAK5303105.1 hypothetical protein LTR99_006062 [Exophiala xenobiotica]KAK5340801.1 hypothetical protein LTR98_003923 [Exophiala xenobiotica]KAK5431298.1 hypothetical protein LTR34_005857 [Exophiala xenobiotica]KAK5540866.1 hypothetical protein LTR25_002643 [Vermiconidia calcicola]